MSNCLIARSKRAAFAATFLIPFAGGAFAQSADGRSITDIEKENAALRAKVHRLEAEKENIGLRAKVDQLQARRPAGTQLVTQIQTTSPDRTLVMADMPMKAAPPPVPYYSWSGFYLGGNIGYGLAIDRARSTFAVPGANVTSADAADTAVTPAGAIGGVQVGYNWQGGPNWLVGFEADFQGSAQKVTSCIQSCITAGGFPQLSTVTQTLDYFATLRGRFGFVDRGNLFYVTGGGAYGHITQEPAINIVAPGPPPGTLMGSASTTENKFGWVVGAGIESSLGGNWTARVEYLYLNLGSTTSAFTGSDPTGNVAPGPVTLNVTSSIHDNIVRAGVNYRFGPPSGPVSAYDAMAAVPPPVYSWTGFYVGGNVGYGFGNDHSQVDLNNSGAQGLFSSEPGTSVTPKGGLGGAQFGYNWQAAPRWVAGFEADLQGTAMNDTVCSSLLCQNQIPFPVSQIVTVQHQLDYFGTVRGRVGYLYNNTLFYGTGGAAFGHVREQLHAVFAFPRSAGETNDFATTKDLTGYVVGGGIEAMLGGGWSAKAEYLYMNLGSISASFDFNNSGSPSTLISNSTVRDHIVRIGANYHIGAAPY